MSYTWDSYICPDCDKRKCECHLRKDNNSNDDSDSSYVTETWSQAGDTWGQSYYSSPKIEIKLGQERQKERSMKGLGTLVLIIAIAGGVAFLESCLEKNAKEDSYSNPRKMIKTFNGGYYDR